MKCDVVQCKKTNFGRYLRHLKTSTKKMYNSNLQNIIRMIVVTSYQYKKNEDSKKKNFENILQKSNLI